ncbi:MAG: glutamate 5-kinase [Desulfobacterota bacterium]|nr:glutamate 5-kinase [Thermodesulfobacteriota bacterium]MDW8002185.1 glutamate 5-kinase [Deltaproteobacteria bacterium]
MTKISRLVVKVGTSILTDKLGRINPQKIKDIARQIKKVKEMGVDPLVVTSGAIACGMELLGINRKPKEIGKKQALASVGQVILMSLYSHAFKEHNLHIGQILLTHEDVKDKDRCLNLTNTLNTLLSLGIIPVVNENDALSFREIQFGDNDNLSATIAQIVNADLLLLLSDVDGLYEKNPKKYPGANLVKVVKKIDERIWSIAEGTESEKSIGGMLSKIEAAKKAGLYGIPTRIVSGDTEEVIVRVVLGEELGTLFLPERKLSRKKWWTAFAFRTKGKIWIDDGAEKAIKENGKSLLPTGVLKVEGDFSRGDCVEVVNIKGVLISKGIVNYGSHEIDLIKGLKTIEIEQKLGYKYTEEVIHRDNMVIL